MVAVLNFAMIKILLDFQPLPSTTSHAVLENKGEKNVVVVVLKKMLTKDRPLFTE